MSKSFKETAVNKESIFGWAARLLRAETSQAKPTKLSDILNLTTGALASGWNDFGATDWGLSMKRGFDKTGWSVDQILWDIDEFITNWKMSLEFSCAQASLENVKIARAGWSVTVDTALTPNESRMGIWAPETIDEKMLAFIVDKRKVAWVNYVRGYIFRRCKRDGSDSDHSYKKGEKTLIPTVFTALADDTAASGEEFAIILDQVVA